MRRAKPVISGSRTWLDLARYLPSDELVAVGDALFRAGHLDPASGLFVLSSAYLRRQGRCCGQGCRHCPWPPDVQARLATRAARAGRHLLLDKPLALTVPDADELVEAAGRYADRLSVNLELPTTGDLQRLAPEKSHAAIEHVMADVRAEIDAALEQTGPLMSPREAKRWWRRMQRRGRWYSTPAMWA